MATAQQGQGVSAGLLPFLEVLNAAGQPGFRWDAQALAAAFQWGNTLAQLAGGPAAPALRDLLQEVSSRLPPWLGACGAALAEGPRALLLAVLLQRPTPDPAAWFQLVVGSYVAACVLELPAGAERAGAEADLTRVLVHLGQQQLLGQLSAQLLEEATASAPQALVDGLRTPEQGGQQEQRAAALAYFTSQTTLAAAAAAQLLLQALAAGSLDLGAFLGPSPSSLELEVLCLAALVPVWEGVVRRAAGSATGGGRHLDVLLDGSQRAAWELVQAQLRGVCESSPGALLTLPPPLLAEVCRESFGFRCEFTVLLQRRAGDAGEQQGAGAVVAAHMQALQLQASD